MLSFPLLFCSFFSGKPIKIDLLSFTSLSREALCPVSVTGVCCFLPAARAPHPPGPLDTVFWPRSDFEKLGEACSWFLVGNEFSPVAWKGPCGFGVRTVGVTTALARGGATSTLPPSCARPAPSGRGPAALPVEGCGPGAPGLARQRLPYLTRGTNGAVPVGVLVQRLGAPPGLTVQAPPPAAMMPQGTGFYLNFGRNRI